MVWSESGGSAHRVRVVVAEDAVGERDRAGVIVEEHTSTSICAVLVYIAVDEVDDAAVDVDAATIIRCGANARCGGAAKSVVVDVAVGERDRAAIDLHAPALGLALVVVDVAVGDRDLYA